MGCQYFFILTVQQKHQSIQLPTFSPFGPGGPYEETEKEKTDCSNYYSIKKTKKLCSKSLVIVKTIMMLSGNITKLFKTGVTNHVKKQTEPLSEARTSRSETQLKD